MWLPLSKTTAIPYSPCQGITDVANTFRALAIPNSSAARYWRPTFPTPARRRLIHGSGLSGNNAQRQPILGPLMATLAGGLKSAVRAYLRSKTLQSMGLSGIRRGGFRQVQLAPPSVLSRIPAATPEASHHRDLIVTWRCGIDCLAVQVRLTWSADGVAEPLLCNAGNLGANSEE